MASSLLGRHVEAEGCLKWLGAAPEAAPTGHCPLRRMKLSAGQGVLAQAESSYAMMGKAVREGGRLRSGRGNPNDRKLLHNRVRPEAQSCSARDLIQSLADYYDEVMVLWC